MSRLKKFLEQISFLIYETRIFVGRRWWQAPFFIFNEAYVAVAIYRIDRALYLLFGEVWVFLRIILSPIAFLVGPWTGRGRCTIHYQADIGQGLKILHPELGILVTGFTVAGRNLIFTGGNLIGSKRRNLTHGDVMIGNDVMLGANAVVLGPIQIPDNVKIGAGSVALTDLTANDVAFGVPAVSLFRRKRQGAIMKRS